jgi:protein TonB
METKKSNRANLERKRSMFFQAGLLLALGVSFVAFEWQMAPRISDVVWNTIQSDVATWEVPNTSPPEIPLPPPVLQVSLELKIVDDSEVVAGIPDIILNVEEGYNILSTDGFSSAVIDIDTTEQVIFIPGLVESPALFKGKPAEEAFREYISQNLNYPQVALENGIAGRVFVQFVVDQRGQVVDIQVTRNVDPLLDNETLRLIKSTSGMWTPARQREKPVKVRYTFPIMFKLQ